MSINQIGQGQPQRIPSKPHFQIQQPTNKTEAGAGDKSDAVQRIRNPQVVELVRQLEDSPEIRTELVDQVIQKLQGGEYFTRQSAEDVASEILKRL